MKRFQMITEADARVIDYGSTVALVAGGHVTPLAADTLKARRVSVDPRKRRRGRRLACAARRHPDRRDRRRSHLAWR